MSPPHLRVPRSACYANTLAAPLVLADVNVTVGVVGVIAGIIALVLVLLVIIAVEVTGEHRENVRAHLHR
jgi:hypothetical protein